MRRVSAGRPVLCLPSLRKSDQFIIKATEGNRELRGIAPSKSVRRRASSYVRSPLEIKNSSANSSNGKSHAISTAVNYTAKVNPAELQFTREFILRTRSRYCYLLSSSFFFLSRNYCRYANNLHFAEVN